MVRGQQPVQCRNCQCYLDDEFRYCPRCGAPSSLRWPAAGGAWLRRPAAIAGLSLFVIAWLVALQQQLWAPLNRWPIHLPSASHRIAERPATKELVLPWREQDGWLFHSSALAHPAGGPSTRTHLQVARRTATVRSRAPISRTATDRVHQPTPRPAAPSPVAPRSLPPAITHHTRSRDRYQLAALPRYPLPAVAFRYAHPRPAARPARPWMRLASRGASSRPPVRVHAPGIASGRRPAYGSNTTVNIAASPYREKTYVYLNGTTELGQAPLHAQFPHPGHYKLFFFTPGLGPRGRKYKAIDVTGRGPQYIKVAMGPPREIARANDD